MPTIFRYDGFKFFFYSNEGDPRGPVHVHVMKAGAEAKFWLHTEVTMARSAGFDAQTLRRLERIVTEKRALIEGVWDEYFG